MSMTNDEYHDILDAIKAAKADFRYTSSNNDGTTFDVEAYQITPRSRFENSEWPNWLQMQKSPTEVNRVYCEADNPNDLTLMMVGGVEQPLGHPDWLVLYKNGDITVLTDHDFRNFEKVIPVPDAPVLPESAPGFEEQFELDENNKLIPRKTPLKVVQTIAEEAIDLAISEKPTTDHEVVILADEIVGLENVVIDSLDWLQNEKPDKAIELLKEALEERVMWCGCGPGKCDKSQVLGCRIDSPLVK